MATHGNNAHIVDFFYSHITVPNHVFIFRQFDCINGSISHFTLHSLTRSGSFCIEWHIFEAKFSTPRPGRGRGQNSDLEALASLVMGFQPVSFQLPVPFRSRLSARHGTDRQTDRQTDNSHQCVIPLMGRGMRLDGHVTTFRHPSGAYICQMPSHRLS